MNERAAVDRFSTFDGRGGEKRKCRFVDIVMFRLLLVALRLLALRSHFVHDVVLAHVPDHL